MDRQRAAALQRFVIGGPVPGLVGRGRWSAHAVQLPRRIHEMNPPRNFCKKPEIPRIDLCRHAGRRGKVSLTLEAVGPVAMSELRTSGIVILVAGAASPRPDYALL